MAKISGGDSLHQKSLLQLYMQSQNTSHQIYAHHDGSYAVTNTCPEHSEYTVKLPNNPNTFSGFHTHLPKWYTPNDPLLSPDHAPLLLKMALRSSTLTKLWMHSNTAGVYNTLLIINDMGRSMTSGVLTQKWLILTPLTNGNMKMGQRSENHSIFSSGKECKSGPTYVWHCKPLCMATNPCWCSPMFTPHSHINKNIF